MSGEHHDGDMLQVPTFINNVVNKKGSVHVSSFLLTPEESLPSDHCCLAAFNPVALPDSRGN